MAQPGAVPWLAGPGLAACGLAAGRAVFWVQPPDAVEVRVDARGLALR